MKSLERIASIVFGLVFLFLSLAVGVETVSRKVFNVSLQGVDELGGYCLAVGGALAFAVALSANAHIRIDLVHDRLARAPRILLNILSVLSLAVTALVLAWMAWLAFADSITFNATAQTPWATPLRYPQGVWVAALVLFLAIAAVLVIGVLLALARGRWSQIDRQYSPRGSKDELEEELADLKARGADSMAGPR